MRYAIPLLAATLAVPTPGEPPPHRAAAVAPADAAGLVAEALARFPGAAVTARTRPDGALVLVVRPADAAHPDPDPDPDPDPGPDPRAKALEAARWLLAGMTAAPRQEFAAQAAGTLRRVARKLGPAATTADLTRAALADLAGRMDPDRILGLVPTLADDGPLAPLGPAARAVALADALDQIAALAAGEPAAP